jgi:hypothetical protein
MVDTRDGIMVSRTSSGGGLCGTMISRGCRSSYGGRALESGGWSGLRRERLLLERIETVKREKRLALQTRW